MGLSPTVLPEKYRSPSQKQSLSKSSETTTTTMLMSLQTSKIIPDVLPSSSSDIQQTKISYGDRNISYDMELTPSQAHEEPKLSWSNDANKFYTLFMTDPDAPGVEDHSFREFMHWVVTDIPGDDIKFGNVVVDYLGPAPPYDSGI